MHKKNTKLRLSLFSMLILAVSLLVSLPIQFNSIVYAAEKNSQQVAIKGNVNVKDFGAIGDGIADDTQAIRKALTKISSANNTIFFPKGTYRVNDTIMLPSNVQIQGTGKGSRLVMGRSLINGIFSALGQEHISISGLFFEGMNIEHTKRTTERLIFFDHCSAVSIIDCDLSKTIIAIQGQGCVGIFVTKCHIHDIKHRDDYSQGYGMLFNLSCTDVTVSLNLFSKIGRHAIYLSSGTSNTKILDNTIDGSESSAISLYSKSSQKVVDNIIISGNDIRNVSGKVSPRGISIAVWCNNIIVKKNRINNIEQYGIAVEGGALEEMGHNPSNIVIEENTIENGHNAGVWVVNSSNIKVQKNSIDAISGIVASTAGKLQGSYLKLFSATNNEITYKKDGIIIGGKSNSTGYVLRENTFKPVSMRTKNNIQIEK